MSKSTDELLADVWRAISQHNPEAKRSMRAIESQLRQARSDVAKYRPLQDMPGAAQLIPLRYQSAVVALSIIAHHGIRRPEDSGSAKGKLTSRPPKHDSVAMHVLKRELDDLDKRARRIESFLARRIDGEGHEDAA